MANPLSNPAGNFAPRWVYQAILVEMTDKTLYGLRATQRQKKIRGIFNGGVSPHVCAAVTYNSQSEQVYLTKHIMHCCNIIMVTS